MRLNRKGKETLLFVALGLLCSGMFFVSSTRALDLRSTITTTIADQGYYRLYKNVSVGEHWLVEWKILQGGNGFLNVSIVNSTGYRYFYNSTATNGSYTLVANISTEYTAVFFNQGGSSVQVELSEGKISGEIIVPGYPSWLIITILVFVPFITLRNLKRHRGLEEHNHAGVPR